MNDDNTQAASLIQNPNGTIELTLAGELNRANLEKILHRLLLQIVQLRDKGRQVLIFVNTTRVQDTGEDVSGVALKFLQTDFDYMAIYDESFGHRLAISKMARSIDNGEHRINVFKNVDEATGWVNRMRSQADKEE